MAQRRSAPRRSSRSPATEPARPAARRADAVREDDPGRPTTTDAWATGLTEISRDRIMVRGYLLDELMGRVSFGEAIHLLLTGELPAADVGRLVEALLVSTIDHGATPPSTLAARNVATTGAPMRAAAAAGVLAFGSSLGGGGSIEACAAFLDDGLELVGDWVSYDDAARRLLDQRDDDELPPGFGHRYHHRDPRAARLLQLALELELEDRHIQLLRAIEHVLIERAPADAPPPRINIDGAIAAVCGDLGLGPETASVLFMISRLPGIVAHAIEEQQRQPRHRQIDPIHHVYDGPGERRLPQPRR